MKMKTLAIASVSMLASIAASARTVAWYSMEGVVGERPLPADVVENRAAPGTLQLIPGHPNGTRCPVFTNGFPAAWHVYDPVSGRFVEVLSDQPGLQVYTGNFFVGGEFGANGNELGFRSSIALEAQRWPDSVNNPSFTPSILRPGETYTSSTGYRFGVL